MLEEFILKNSIDTVVIHNIFDIQQEAINATVMAERP